MPLESFTANDLIYTVSPEPELPDEMKTWAVLQAHLVDEITGQPPSGDVSIETSFLGISPRVSSGGLVGFVAIPARAFPSRQTQNYLVQATIEAQGYIPISATATIKATTTFPATFSPTGILNLRRLPTVIAGRVALNTGTAFQPINNASITLTGLWRTPPPANLVVPPDPPDLVSLGQGLYFDRAQAGTQVQGINLSGAPGADKQLLQDADAGQNSLRLSDRKLIANGDILAIDAVDPARTEYISIHSIAGASTDSQPATITLDMPLRGIHRQGAVVHKVQFANTGVPTPLTADAFTGDVCLFVNGVANLSGAAFVSLQDGTNPTEYQAVSYFSTVSDANGFFRWPPLSRVAQCAVHAHDGAHPDLDVTFTPNYPEEVSRLDFVYQ